MASGLFCDASMTVGYVWTRPRIASQRNGKLLSRMWKLTGPGELGYAGPPPPDVDVDPLEPTADAPPPPCAALLPVAPARPAPAPPSRTVSLGPEVSSEVELQLEVGATS